MKPPIMQTLAEKKGGTALIAGSLFTLGLLAYAGSLYLPSTGLSLFTGSSQITVSNFKNTWSPNESSLERRSLSGVTTQDTLKAVDGLVQIILDQGSKKNLSESQTKQFLKNLSTGLSKLQTSNFEDNAEVQAILRYLIAETTLAEQALGTTPGTTASTSSIPIGITQTEQDELLAHLQAGATSGDFKHAVAYVFKKSIAPYYIVELARTRMNVPATESQVVDYINTQYTNIQNDQNLPANIKLTVANITTYKALFGKDGSVASVIGAGNGVQTAQATQNTNQTAQSQTTQPTGCTPGNEEVYYLEKNPDVKEAIRSGSSPSGAHHWNTYGMQDGRPSCWNGAASLSTSKTGAIQVAYPFVTHDPKYPAAEYVVMHTTGVIKYENNTLIAEEAGMFPASEWKHGTYGLKKILERYIKAMDEDSNIGRNNAGENIIAISYKVDKPQGRLWIPQRLKFFTMVTTGIRDPKQATFSALRWNRSPEGYEEAHADYRRIAQGKPNIEDETHPLWKEYYRKSGRGVDWAGKGQGFGSLPFVQHGQWDGKNGQSHTLNPAFFLGEKTFMTAGHQDTCIDLNYCGNNFGLPTLGSFGIYRFETVIPTAGWIYYDVTHTIAASESYCKSRDGTGIGECQKPNGKPRSQFTVSLEITLETAKALVAYPDMWDAQGNPK